MKVKTIAIYGILISLSVVGSFIVIPSSAGSVALDSFVAYIGACLFSPLAGGSIGFLAHLISSYLKGFPLGLIFHLIIGLMMILSVTVFGFLYKRRFKKLAIIIGIFFNTTISVIPFIFLINLEFFLAMQLPLLISSTANICLAVIIYEGLQKRKIV